MCMCVVNRIESMLRYGFKFCDNKRKVFSPTLKILFRDEW